jgi:hypothetical protein
MSTNSETGSNNENDLDNDGKSSIASAYVLQPSLVPPMYYRDMARQAFLYNNTQQIPESNIVRIPYYKGITYNNQVTDDDNSSNSNIFHHNNGFVPLTASSVPFSTSSSFRYGTLLSLVYNTPYEEIDPSNPLKVLHRHPVIAANPYWMTYEATAYLAMLHFNNRMLPYSKLDNTTLSKHKKDHIDWQPVLDSCDFYMDMSFRNTGLAPVIAAQQVYDEYFVTETADADGSSSTTTIPQSSRIVSFASPYAIAGPVRSAEATLVATLTGLQTWTGLSGGLPVISPSATSSQLDDKTSFPFFGRTSPTNLGDAQALVTYLQRIQVQRFAVIYVHDEYGSAFMEQIVTEATLRYNMNVHVFSYRDDVPGSLESALQQLQALEGCVYHFAIPSGGIWGEFMIQLSQHNLIGPDRMWLYGEGVIDAVGLEVDPIKDADLIHALNRTAFIVVDEPSNLMQKQKELLQDFLVRDDLLDDFWNIHIGGALSVPMSTSGYTRDEIRSWLQTPSFNAMMMYEAVFGLGLAVCQYNSSLPTGPEIFDAFKQLDFDGASGRVTFFPDTGTRDPVNLGYQLINVLVYTDDVNDKGTVQVNGVKSAVIHLATGEYEQLTPLIYSDGGTIPPPSLPALIEDRNLVGSKVILFCWILASIGVIVSIVFAFLSVLRRSLPQIQASQPFFLVLLCTGTFLMACSIFPTTLQEPMESGLLNTGCMLDLCLLSLGFSTTFAALFSKTWRINRLHRNSKKFRRVQIGARDVLWPFAILATLNVVVLTVWTVMSPLEYTRTAIDYDHYGRVSSSAGTCFSSDRGLIFVPILVAINACALILANVQSFLARGLPSQFNESRDIAITNFVLLEGLFFGVPVLLVVGNNPTSYVLVRTMLTTVFVIAVLMPLVVQKFSHKYTSSVRHVNNRSSFMFSDHSRSLFSKMARNGSIHKSQASLIEAELEDDDDDVID